MSEEPTVTARIKYAFRLAEHVQDRDFKRFEPFLARHPEETDAAYAARLERAGLTVAITSEQMRDVPGYRARIDEATSRGVPIAYLSAVLTGPVFDEATREAQKAAALAAARSSQT